MFGDISPKLYSLLSKNNVWTGINRHKLSNMLTSPLAAMEYINPTPSTATTQVQASPAIKFESHAWRSVTAVGDQKAHYRIYTLPVATSSQDVQAILKIQPSINSETAFTDLLDIYNRNPDGNPGGLLKFQGSGLYEFSQSNQDPATSTAFTLSNTSGAYTNLSFKYASTIKAAITVGNDANTYFKLGSGSASFYFQVGSTVTSPSTIVQLYSGGIYNYGGSFNQGRVTAGSADITPPGFLTTFGSFAVKGTPITSATYQITANEHIIYGDSDTANICSGTPAACSSYTGSGQVTCETHTGVGCSWNAGTDCGTSGNGTDSGTCTGQGAGCTWQSASCSSANNTDQATCEALDDAYSPGTCTWDTSTCPSFTSTATCNAQAGCSATVAGDCTTLSDGGGDGTNCATQSECSYDSGSGVCSGTYFTSCDGNLCTGTYYNGTCSGTYGTACEGTADCANLTDDGSGPCAIESGCTWTSGATYTLPSSATANEGNVSIWYWVYNIGSTGNIAVVAYSGDTMNAAITLTPGQKCAVHHFNRSSNCTDFVSEGTCTPTGCTWVAAIVCADLMDESSCNAQSGAGCSWSGSCTGAGSAAYCDGTYTSSKKWYRFV